MVTLINVLVALRLQNIALIDSLNLAFERGFIAFTGETGAGKSIFLDAIDLLLGGGKPSSMSRLIQKGSNKAFVEGCFLKNSLIERWFRTNQFDIDSEEFFITRDWTMKDDKWSNRFRLNGMIINKHQILSLRSLLIDFTAQGHSQSFNLLNNQSSWIDKFGTSIIEQPLKAVNLSWENWKKVSNNLETSRLKELESKNEKDAINQFLIDLENANIDDPLEDIKLKNEQDRLVHGVKLKEGLETIFTYLKADTSNFPTALSSLSSAIRELKVLSSIDNSLSCPLDEAINLYSDLDKMINYLDNYYFNLDSNPNRLDEIQERILTIKRIQTRYNLTLKELINKRDEYNNLILNNKHFIQLESLEKEEKSLRNIRDKDNKILTNIRMTLAKKFETVLMKYLKLLGLIHVKFEVQIIPCKPSSNGADKISFLFSANPDQPLAPLAEIASGGEMSRFLLALKTALADANGASTFIFDEIDSGVSGRISSSIARLLKELSLHKQVFCVTHQPLVAAMADHHFSVSKTVKNGLTRSAVTSLEGFEARKRELAELAGGDFEEAALYAASLLEKKAA